MDYKNIALWSGIAVTTVTWPLVGVPLTFSKIASSLNKRSPEIYNKLSKGDFLTTIAIGAVATSVTNIPEYGLIQKESIENTPIVRSIEGSDDYTAYNMLKPWMAPAVTEEYFLIDELGIKEPSNGRTPQGFLEDVISDKNKKIARLQENSTENKIKNLQQEIDYLSQ